MAETPVLQVEHLTMRYGEGCPHCKDHLEKNRCTVCGTVWAANDIFSGSLSWRGAGYRWGKRLRQIYFDAESVF